MNGLLNKYSVKAKVLGVSIFYMALLTISSGYALFSMSQIDNELTGIAEKDIPMTQLLTAITEHQLEQAILFERAVRYGDLLEIEDSAAGHFRENINAFEVLSHKVTDEIRKGKMLAELIMTDLSHGKEVAEEFSHIDHELIKIEKQHQSYENHAQEVFVILAQGKVHEAESFIEKVEGEENELNRHLEELLLEVGEFTAQALLKAEQHEHQARIVLGIIFLVAVVLGLFISWHVMNNISNLLSETKTSLNKIAEGDLTEVILIQGDDGLTNVLITMQKKLLSLISLISSTVSQLAAAAEETSVVVNDTQSHMQQQQTETEMVATAMNEMTATVQEISRNIADTAGAASNANNEIVTGTQLVNQTGLAIQELADGVLSATNIIHEVESESNTIGSVLDVIKSIAEQTNLLALNAAIEAARAGEQGRGFAVVADEVRTLAGRTQSATEEINQMIISLQNGSKKAVDAMNSSCDQAQTAVKQADQAANSITTIADSVDRINQMSEQIASAAEEQNAVSEEINRNIVTINDTATSSVTNSAQIAAASEELAKMATELQSRVNSFKVT